MLFSLIIRGPLFFIADLVCNGARAFQFFKRLYQNQGLKFNKKYAPKVFRDKKDLLLK